MTIIATLYKVECNFTWQDRDSVDTWTFGSLEGAKKFAEERIHELRWYAISGYEYIPCDENDPCGQLYMGMIHHEFYEVEDQMVS